MSFIINNRSKSNTRSNAKYAGYARIFASVRNGGWGKIFLYLFFTTILSACGGKNSSGTADQSASNSGTAQTSDKKTILFFGDSITAGYGLDDPSDAFPGVIQRKIDSAKLPYTVVNAGVSGETTAGGLARINWVLKQKTDIFILELGANDGLRGMSVGVAAQNLQAIVDKVKAKYPHAKLVMLGMQIPPSMGSGYAESFKAIFPKVAADNKMALVPFLLNGVGGDPKLNQHDGIHPTAEGAKIVANNVWKVLRGEL